MPTARPRIMLTESDALAADLDFAARSWPEFAESRSALSLRLIELGAEALRNQVEERKAQRLKAVEQIAGSMNGVWPEGWREELRSEWPE